MSQLSSMNVLELKQLAKERNVPSYYKLKKAELIQALSSGSKNRASPKKSPMKSPKKYPKQSLARKSPAKTVRRSPARTSRRSPARTVIPLTFSELPEDIIPAPLPKLPEKDIASFTLKGSVIKSFNIPVGSDQTSVTYPYLALPDVYNLYEATAAEEGKPVTYDKFAMAMYKVIGKQLKNLPILLTGLDINFSDLRITIDFAEYANAHPLDMDQLDAAVKKALMPVKKDVLIDVLRSF